MEHRAVRLPDLRRLLLIALALSVASWALACGGETTERIPGGGGGDDDESETSTADETEDPDDEPTEDTSNDDDSGEDGDGSSEESANGDDDIPATELAAWTLAVCDAAMTFQESTSSFSDDINATDLSAPDAKDQVLALYAGFAESLHNFKGEVVNLYAGDTEDGEQARETWVNALLLAIEQNNEIVAEVEALEAETFGETYTDLITNWGDDFSDHDLRGQLSALTTDYPEVQTGVIDVVDETEGCAEAAF